MTTELALDGGAKMTATGLELPAEMSHDSWVEYGNRLNHMEHALMWWLGDWWNYGERRYGDLIKASENTGWAPDTIDAAARVARKVESRIRIRDLPWAHHQNVASLEPEEQRQFLSRWEATRIETGKAPAVREARQEVKIYNLNKKGRKEIGDGGDREPSGSGWHQLGPHWLYCGDSTDPEFVDRCAGARFVFADPPYNADKAEWDSGFVWDHDYLAEAADIVAVTPGIAALAEFLGKTGMPYLWTVAAEITNGMTRGALGFGNWIAVPLFSSDSLYRNAKDVIHIAAGTSDDQGGIHPSRKPIRLINELLELFTNPGDIVVDPFLGSGTTLIAADKLGRRCIGAELDPTYTAHIIKRYEEQQ